MWNYAGSAQAFAFFGRLGPVDRRRLLRVLDQMAAHPPAGERSGLKDEAGRELLVWRDEGIEILFWLDQAAKELRVVEIDWSTAP